MIVAKIGISQWFGLRLRNARRSWSIASLSAFRFAAVASTIAETCSRPRRHSARNPAV
jgi:hypothetical protein